MNLLRPYKASIKPPSERPLFSDTCLTSYFSTSANAAVTGAVAVGRHWCGKRSNPSKSAFTSASPFVLHPHPTQSGGRVLGTPRRRSEIDRGSRSTHSPRV